MLCYVLLLVSCSCCSVLVFVLGCEVNDVVLLEAKLSVPLDAVFGVLLCAMFGVL